MASKRVVDLGHINVGPLKEAIIDPKRISQLLSRAVDEGAKALFHPVNQAPAEDASSQPEPLAKGTLIEVTTDSIELELTTEQLDASKGRLTKAGPELFIALYLKNASVIGTRLRVQSITGNRIRLVRPKSIYLIQRRRNPRYSIPSGYEIRAQVLSSSTDLIGSFRIVDLSSTGMGIEVSDTNKFQLFETLSRVIVRFRLQNQQFEAGAHIRSRNNHKVGLEFDGLSDVSKEWLEDFVTSQLAQYLNR